MEKYELDNPSWIKVETRNPKIGDWYYCKVDTKEDCILRTIVEFYEYADGRYDFNLNSVNHFPGFKEDAKVIEWLRELTFQ